MDSLEFAHPSPSPSKAPSERSMRPTASSSSLGSLPENDKPVWRRFMSRAGSFLRDMVDLDDDEDNVDNVDSVDNVDNVQVIGPDSDEAEEAYNRRWPPHARRRDDDNIRTEPLGDTKEPTSLHRTGDYPDNDEPDGFHFDHHPSEPSQLVSTDDMNAISSHAPLRHRHKKWVLLYSTLRDGISMQTLLRKAKGHAPTVLLVRDMSRNVFGAFCSESWRVSQRYFGTGETFVFRVDPDPAVWKWWWQKSSEQQNDFFQWGSPEGIAVGGAGGYAIWLDSELCRGISRCSLTFGNSCLASREEYLVGAVELWHLL